MISDFIFDGIQLSDLGYLAYQQDREDVTAVSAMKFETIKAAQSDISHRVGYNYESNYTTTFSIMRLSCDDPENDYLTNDDIAELTRWLSRKQYKWFREIDDNEENDDEIWYKVQIQINKEYVGANVSGLQLIIEASTPYGFTREKKTKIEGITDSFSVTPYSDEEGYIYPNIKITCNGAGTLKITNTNENRSTQILNCTDGEVITITGIDLLQINSSTDHDFSNDFNYVFPRFVVEYKNYKNDFEVEFQGTIDVEMTYRGIRKVGF